MNKTRNSFRPAGLLTRGMIVLALLALSAASLPQPALAAQVACARNHTVSSGDTVSNLAETYKVTTAELIAANSLTEPYTIFVGQVLCIPGTATSTASTSAGTTSAASTGPVMQISIVGNKLVIETANFPKTKASFYVKAGEKRSTYSDWIRLGRMLVRKDGAGDGIFLLPKALRNTRVIEVCMKNVETDAVYCGRIVQPK